MTLDHGGQCSLQFTLAIHVKEIRFHATQSFLPGPWDRLPLALSARMFPWPHGPSCVFIHQGAAAGKASGRDALAPYLSRLTAGQRKTGGQQGDGEKEKMTASCFRLIRHMLLTIRSVER